MASFLQSSTGTTSGSTSLIELILSAATASTNSTSTCSSPSSSTSSSWPQVLPKITEWVAQLRDRVSKALDTALGSLDDATDIACVQSKVWRACVEVEVGLKKDGGARLELETDW